jgi:ethanolamine utilization protein EutA
VFCRNVALPVKNLPVAVFTAQEQDDPSLDEIIARRLSASDSDTVVLAFAGAAKSYDRLSMLAEKIVKGTKGKAVYVCLQADMAKALGQKICLSLPEGIPCLCLDRVQLSEESFLDVGKPVGSAFPVVVKTLVLQAVPADKFAR